MISLALSTKTFASLFSGAGGADVGLKRAGMRPLWTCEYDPRCQDVLRYHDPEIPIHPDVRTFDPETCAVPDALWASPPCQDLSVAGKRGGLAGDRSGLFYEFIRIAGVLVRRGTRYLLMEQVPGLFSSHGGEDLRSALLAFLELGPVDLGWRVLDSQWYGVAQRRLRAFFVLDFGGRRAGEILALLEGLSGHPKPSRASGEASPGGTSQSFGIGSHAGVEGGGVSNSSHKRGGPTGFGIVHEGVNTLRAGRTASIAYIHEPAGFDPAQLTHKSNRSTLQEGLVPTLSATGTMSIVSADPSPTLMAKGNLSLDPSMEVYVCSEVSGTLMASGAGMERAAGMPDEVSYCVGVLGDVSHTLAAEGFDASEDGTGRGTPVVALSFDWQKGNDAGNVRPSTMSVEEERTGTLGTTRTPAVAYVCQGSNVGPMGTLRAGNGNASGGVPFVTYVPEVGYTLRANPSASGDKGDGGVNTSLVGTRTRVRRLTPRECERLQGWPDDHTRYGRRADGTVYELADGPRYRMMGNGVTATVSEILGRALVDDRPLTQDERDRREHSLAPLRARLAEVLS